MKPSSITVLRNIINPDTNIQSEFVIPVPSYQYNEIDKLQEFLIPYLDELEQKVNKNLNEHSDGNTGVLGLTSAHRYYNIINIQDKSIYDFKQWLKECFIDYQKMCLGIEPSDNIKMTCWGNKLQQFENIKLHCHSSVMNPNMYTAHFDLYIPKNKTATIYYDLFFDDMFLEKPNKDGELTILPCNLKHKSTPNGNEECRYTLGMDIVFDFDFNYKGQKINMFKQCEDQRLDEL